MKINRIKFTALFIGLSIVSATVAAQADAQRLSKRQLEIIQNVQAADGYLDEKTHREFWAAMPAAMRRPEGQKYLRRLMEQVGDARQNFIRQSWLSAKASLSAKRVVRTQGYIEARANVLAASKNAGYQEKTRESIGSAENMLSAAASGEPLNVRGTKTFITLDLIDHVLASIGSSEFRVAKLINPRWEERVTKFDYPEAHVSVLASSPFVVEQTKLMNSAGKVSNMVMLTQSRGEAAHLAISFSETGGRLLDPAKSVASVARAALAGAGAVGREPAVFDWRGRTSATAAGTAVTSEGTVYMSVRVIEVREFGGVIQFFAVSIVSSADAILLRRTLEDSANIQQR